MQTMKLISELNSHVEDVDRVNVYVILKYSFPLFINKKAIFT